MVVCVHIPRFALTVAAGGAEALTGKALALAPSTGEELRVGEASGAAEAHGVAAGMALGEALARCPELELVAADPVSVADAWEAALEALEAIGAAVEPEQEGTAYFEADGLRGLHGSDQGTIAVARGALARPARLGAGPTRFSALAAALSARGRRPKILDAGGAHALLTRTPVELLARRARTAMLVVPLRRLGVRTLGELRGLGAAAMSDRFGDAGLLAYGLAAGTDTPLAPRQLEGGLSESLHVGDGGSGQMLARVLGVLVDRLLANPRRRGRTLRAVVLAAELDGGGSWHERVVFREPLGDRERVCLSLAPRLALLPAPAHVLRLGVDRFGPATGDQQALLEQDAQARRERLREAVRQVRLVAGHDAALRAVCIDPDSRVPERRVVLAPLP
ncbi:MAG TPA: hypothetical protein VFW38_12825 [Solirubrobacteraceae bacterium]|nr:hypothetical protein [Solirubrobacteraceae bacterium]